MRKTGIITIVFLLLAAGEFITAETYEQHMYGGQEYTFPDDPELSKTPTYDNEINAEDSNISEVSESDSAVGDAGDASGATSEAESEVSGDEAEAGQEKAEGEKSQEKNIENANDNKEKDNSDSSGDPVRITEGYYEQNETDIQITNGFGFGINRKYESKMVG